jgi:RNA polymerase sigma-70 factor (ECF subfamily)
MLCLGILGRVHDAEDAAQEAMLKGFVNIGRLRDASRFDAWISKIARNICSDYVRKRMRARERESSRQQMESQSEIADYNLERALEELPEKIRLPLVMHFLDGASVKSVAERLDLSHSGVYLRLRTGISQLHKLMVSKESEK